MEPIRDFLKLVIPAHEAQPTPEISIPLYNSGIDVNNFCTRFNEVTQNMEGNIKIGIVVYNDLSYDILSPEDVAKFEQLQVINEMNLTQREFNFFKQLEHKIK